MAAATATCLAAPSALAVEHEWHFGTSVGYQMLTTAQGSFDGAAGLLHVRYGVTDTLDLSFDAGVSGFPLAVVAADPSPLVTSLLGMSTSAGVSYLIDVGRWIPHIGVGMGVTDLLALECDADPALCRHDLHPTIGIPGGLEYRVAGPLVLGAHVRYQFLLAGDPGGVLFAGAYAGLAH